MFIQGSSMSSWLLDGSAGLRPAFLLTSFGIVCPTMCTSGRLTPGCSWNVTSGAGKRLGRWPPLPPDKPVHPRVRDVAIHDAVFAQRPFAHESELLEDAGGRRVARIGLGLDSIQVQRVECPLQQRPRGLGRVAVAPRRLVEAVAHRSAAVVRVPPRQTAPANERSCLLYTS